MIKASQYLYHEIKYVSEEKQLFLLKLAKFKLTKLTKLRVETLDPAEEWQG